MKENLQQEFNSFMEDVKQEKCFFCGGDPVFVSNIDTGDQTVFFTCCKKCMTGILGEAALSRLELVKEKVTVH